jgi:hypothetical protein
MRDQLLFTILYQLPSLMLGLIILRLKGWPYFRFFLLLPGTVLHELSHWIIAFLLNGKPIQVSLWPKQTDPNNWTLGEVRITHLTWYNGLWIGLAPILGIALMLALTPKEKQWQFTQYDLYQWAISAPIWVTCWPSRVDLGVAFRSSKGLCIAISLIILLLAITSN